MSVRRHVRINAKAKIVYEQVKPHLILTKLLQNGIQKLLMLLCKRRHLLCLLSFELN